MEERKPLQAPALDPATVAPGPPSDYPVPFRALVSGRERRRLGDALGLTNFGVNLMRLPPGCASSQRHWHSRQDEFVYVVAGEVVLVTDGGEQLLTAGMAAGFSRRQGRRPPPHQPRRLRRARAGSRRPHRRR